MTLVWSSLPERMWWIGQVQMLEGLLPVQRKEPNKQSNVTSLTNTTAMSMLPIRTRILSNQAISL